MKSKDNSTKRNRQIKTLKNHREKKNAPKKVTREYHQIVEDVNSIILRMDMEGKVTFLNRFAQKFFGYKKSEILGKSVMDTIVPANESHGRNLKIMVEGILRNPRKHINNINENMLRNGQRVWIAWTNRGILDRDSHPKEILCVGNDISKLKKAEQVLKELSNRKSTFVANVSHEFKNPLAIIKGSLALVIEGLTGEINAEQKTILGTAKKNIERLIRLTTDLLDIVKIEAGKMKLKRENIEIGLLINGIVENNNVDISKKQLTLKKDIPKNCGSLWADKDKVTEVIVNLLGNAIKYTPFGGNIAIKLLGGDNEIRFEISDNGTGIAKSNINKLFNKFECILTEQQEGTGLGLSIAKEIIELHKGKIWVESKLGKGSKFIFVIPRDFAAKKKKRIEQVVVKGHNRKKG